MKLVKYILLVAALYVAANLVTGCSSVTNQITPAVVQQGVATGVSYAVAKYPTAIPYLEAAAPIICSAANGTNLNPAQVVAAIESSPAAALKTPEAVLILNGALTLYIAVWDSYGSNALASSTAIQPYLAATCAGIDEALPASTNAPAMKVAPLVYIWPVVSF